MHLKIESKVSNYINTLSYTKYIYSGIHTTCEKTKQDYYFNISINPPNILLVQFALSGEFLVSSCLESSDKVHESEE